MKYVIEPSHKNDDKVYYIKKLSTKIVIFFLNIKSNNTKYKLQISQISRKKELLMSVLNPN